MYNTCHLIKVIPLLFPALFTFRLVCDFFVTNNVKERIINTKYSRTRNFKAKFSNQIFLVLIRIYKNVDVAFSSVQILQGSSLQLFRKCWANMYRINTEAATRGVLLKKCS